MKRKHLLLTSALVLVFLLVLPVYAKPPIFDELRGWRINVVNGRPWHEIGNPVPVSVYTHVAHGFVTGPSNIPGDPFENYPHWDEMSLRQKFEFLFTARFTLFVDGKPMRLHVNFWYGYDEQQMQNELSKIFWIEFETYTFEPGFHRFTGIWSIRYNGEWIVELKSWDILFVDTPP